MGGGEEGLPVILERLRGNTPNLEHKKTRQLAGLFVAASVLALLGLQTPSSSPRFMAASTPILLMVRMVGRHAQRHPPVFWNVEALARRPGRNDALSCL